MISIFPTIPCHGGAFKQSLSFALDRFRNSAKEIVPIEGQHSCRREQFMGLFHTGYDNVVLTRQETRIGQMQCCPKEMSINLFPVT